MITLETQIVAMLQAIFCGGIAFMIAFKYKRAGSKYHFLPSLCAFGLASLMGQQWLSIVGRILMYGEWPAVSIFNTLTFGIIFILITRAKGNVARMFVFDK
jgi:hypothetical protein